MYKKYKHIAMIAEYLIVVGENKQPFFLLEKYNFQATFYLSTSIFVEVSYSTTHIVICWSILIVYQSFFNSGLMTRVVEQCVLHLYDNLIQLWCARV